MSLRDRLNKLETRPPPDHSAPPWDDLDAPFWTAPRPDPGPCRLETMIGLAASGLSDAAIDAEIDRLMDSP